jgi:hypothetical protein
VHLLYSMTIASNLNDVPGYTRTAVPLLNLQMMDNKNQASTANVHRLHTRQRLKMRGYQSSFYTQQMKHDSTECSPHLEIERV